MVMKCSAACLLALTLLGCFRDAQLSRSFPSRFQKSLPPLGVVPPQDTQQSKQQFTKPLTWKYPEDPKPDLDPVVPFELRYPVAAATVAVECREKDAHVEVKKDFFGIGQLISPADLTLGTCAPIAEDTAAQVLIFEAELQDCGSSLTMLEDTLMYSFTLNYDPQPLGGSPVVRTSKAAVIVECYYQRKHNVSSLPLDPLWIPFSAVKVAEEFLYFTLRLMTDDWQYLRPSYQYFLGDIINIEASVKQYFHVPLRVYVDTCVATATSDPSSSPRYLFLDSGCLLDARITGSTSKFMLRTMENKLEFQLEAFRFQGTDTGLVSMSHTVLLQSKDIEITRTGLQDNKNTKISFYQQLYITCHLRATSTAQVIDSDHRACSYISGGWREAGGSNTACSSCESVIGGGTQVPGDVPVPPRKGRDVSPRECSV
ncbi:zona pellucida sperm-binding protein 3-like isoform X2 [Mastacembelus armatus]|uniref:zona pellucida sperm-binding protein 3-like isoform X2 n=1 Tax=Mastacembelus armatus TaxID=205130 RepID=UPI000E456494|nr:zona pellucida sperm-binding protein 3-like isoform X2 [Mastacembelus armatus]